MIGVIVSQLGNTAAIHVHDEELFPTGEGHDVDHPLTVRRERRVVGCGVAELICLTNSPTLPQQSCRTQETGSYYQHNS
jgi:hypothetical protein